MVWICWPIYFDKGVNPLKWSKYQQSLCINMKPQLYSLPGHWADSRDGNDAEPVRSQPYLETVRRGKGKEPSRFCLKFLPDFESSFFPIFTSFPRFLALIFRCQGWHSAPLHPQWLRHCGRAILGHWFTTYQWGNSREGEGDRVPPQTLLTGKFLLNYREKRGKELLLHFSYFFFVSLSQSNLKKKKTKQTNKKQNKKQKQTRAVLGFRGLRVARLIACGCWV